MQTPTSLMNYTYDADGIRVSSSVDGVVTDYIVDKNRDYAQVLEERDDSAILVASYVYGDDLINQNRNGSKSYYHYDGQMSTRMLTDEAEINTDNYIYDAFGILLYRSGTTVNDYLYNGEQYDINIGFYYLRARYYNQNLGRFLSTDPFPGSIFEPYSLHKYIYANANPVIYSDPSGMMSLMSVMVTVAIIGILASYAAAGYLMIRLFDYLPPDAFTSSPDAGLLGYQVSVAPTAWLAKSGSLVAAGFAAALALVAGMGGIDVLVPLSGPSLRLWIYVYFGLSINLIPTHYSLVAGGSIAGYSGFVWNVKKPGDYAGSFISFSASSRYLVPSRLRGKFAPGATIFASPPVGGNYGAYGVSFGIGTSTQGASSGASVSLGMSRNFTDEVVISSLPNISLPNLNYITPGGYEAAWRYLLGP